jgi:glycosyltransferase involved in cell wall biosynthesis
MIKQAITDKIDALLFRSGFSSSSFYRQLAVAFATDLQFRRSYLAIENKFSNAFTIKIIKSFFLFKRILRIALADAIITIGKRRSIDDLESSSGIIFLVGKKDGWILHGIANDLIHCIHKCCPGKYQLQVLEVHKLAKQKTIPKSYSFIAMHQNIAIKAVKMGVDPGKIVVYYTHTRDLLRDNVNTFNNCKAVLFQNANELHLLTANGLAGFKAHHYPVGIDLNIFNTNSRPSKLEYDYVISAPLLFPITNPHYFIRKDIPLLNYVLASLARGGKKILILGSGWDKSFLINDSNITIVDCKYQEKVLWYSRSKVFLNLSSYEGGPVTALEALASGCSVLTRPSGLANRLASDFPSHVKIIPDPDPSIIPSYTSCVNYNSLQCHRSSEGESAVLSKLKSEYSFEALAIKLIAILR